MLILNHISSNKQVTAMRPEYSALSFSSPDVPHGTDSVYYKAAKVLLGNGEAISLPQFTQEEKQALIEAKLPSLSVQALLDGEGNPVNLMFLDMTNKVMEPTEAEVDVEFAKKTSSMPMMLETPKYATRELAKDALIAERKLSLATSLVEQAIEQCLVVPTLSDAFKAQFEVVETPEI